MNLIKVTIEKYKCFTISQSFDIDKNTTVLVGVNESGKTAVLEAIAKSNYYNDDKNFKFDTMLDYPRMEKKGYEKTGIPGNATICEYKLDSDIVEKINAEFGYSIICDDIIKTIKKYDNTLIFALNIVPISKKYSETQIFSDEIIQHITDLENLEELNKIPDEFVNNEELIEELEQIKKFFIGNEYSDNPYENYIIEKYILPNLPKFIYYDEYYSLPSRINLLDLNTGNNNDESAKTAKALIELSDLQLSEIIRTNDFEHLIAELEATSNEITDQLFRYWSTNKNLRIEFKIDKTQDPHNVIIPYLDIRIRNELYHLTLPLKNRSKGFIWFFSFIVWFNKIQEDKKNQYILLLDEPGLNLHATAQNDLLKFIENLSEKYQIIYTTHSPFMIDTQKLHQTRTVVEGQNSATISNSILEKDSKTLFPLQAALGYDIAQNLFIGKNNLLVEGPADIILLETISSLLEKEGRTGLNSNITLTPCGGLDKVATFISLLKGNDLNIICLLDSYIETSSKQRLDDLIKQKIIKDSKIRYFDEFIDINGEKAEIEDLFTKDEYLSLFLLAYPEKEKITAESLNAEIPRIIKQIEHYYSLERFNHYLPAYELLKMEDKDKFISKKTLDIFEKMFETINSLFTSI